MDEMRAAAVDLDVLAVGARGVPAQLAGPRSVFLVLSALKVWKTPS